MTCNELLGRLGELEELAGDEDGPEVVYATSGILCALIIALLEKRDYAHSESLEEFVQFAADFLCRAREREDERDAELEAANKREGM